MSVGVSIHVSGCRHAAPIRLSVVGLASCAAPQERVVQMATPALQTPAPGSAASKIQLRGMANEVKVVDIRAQKRAGLLTVQTEIVNGAATNRTLYWRYRRLDEAGMQVGDDESWKPLPSAISPRCCAAVPSSHVRPISVSR